MINRVILIGRFGKDLELRTTPKGVSILNCSLAVNEVRYDKEGNKKEDTQWFNIVAFGNTATNVHKLARKGSLVYIEGKLRTRSYDGKDGEKKYITEVNAEVIRILEGFKESTFLAAEHFKPREESKAALLDKAIDETFDDLSLF